jgi:acyl-lipid omega-6 desaturase (Delta-12 desaturase)
MSSGREVSGLEVKARAFVGDEPAVVCSLLAVTLWSLALALLAALLVPSWPLRLGFSLLAALLQVRLFAFFHDYMHGAILPRSRLARVLMTCVGVWLLVPPSVWRETHNYHHAHNCKLTGSSIGSYPVATTGMWSAMSRFERLQYRWARHPLTILFGYLTVFGYGMNIAPFLRQPARHWSGPLALTLHAAQITLVAALAGFWGALFAVVLPLAVAHALGAYLFYVQHNFVGLRIPARGEWHHVSAALESSSMFVMSRSMHWFTGNIGFHHVHHVNHRIPFYKLPRAMAAIEELQRPALTSFHPRDVWGALRLGLWDAQRGAMLSVREHERA